MSRSKFMGGSGVNTSSRCLAKTLLLDKVPDQNTALAPRGPELIYPVVHLLTYKLNTNTLTRSGCRCTSASLAMHRSTPASYQRKSSDYFFPELRFTYTWSSQMNFPFRVLELIFDINFLLPLAVLYISETQYRTYYAPDGIQPI
jgi:hypothetical protein